MMFWCQLLPIHTITVLLMPILSPNNNLTLANGACHPGGHYRNYYPDALSLYIKSLQLIWRLGTRRFHLRVSQSSNELLRLDQGEGVPRWHWASWRFKLLGRLFNSLFKLTQRKSKFHNTGLLCNGNPPVTNGFPSQRASKAESVSM